MTSIAFLGLGAMGARMAARLQAAGHQLTVWNRSPAAAEALLSRGARAAATPEEAARGAQIVIAMVRDDEASRQVWLHPASGALRGAAPGALLLESSTLTPAWIVEWAGRVRAAGAVPLEVPVVGSRPQADAGQLTVLAGGDAVAIERAAPVLQAYAAAVRHVGPLGQAAIMKLAINALFATQVAAVAELLGWLGRAGLEVERALEVLRALPVMSPAAAVAAGSMVTRQFAPLFPVELVTKDLRYALQSAATQGAALPLTGQVQEAFRRAEEQGFGAEHLTAIARLYQA